MIIDGLVSYFKDLSVSGSLVNVITGWRNKVRLFYADLDVPDMSRSIELDATTEITVSLDTELMQTPAENQKVYTLGALNKPKRIEIKCHIDKTKLEQLNTMRDTIMPVYVLTEKNLSGVITQVGYWSDSSKYGIKSLVQNDTGYANTVAVTIILEEIRLFTYKKEYIYDVKQNTIPKVNKVNNQVSSSGQYTAYQAQDIVDSQKSRLDINKLKKR